ncbi:MAG: hypothetical protein ACK5YI_22365 [Rhodospirillales bacterium]
MRLVVRLIGLALLLAAAGVVVLDLVAGAGRLAPDAGALWDRMHPYSRGLAQVVVQRHLLPDLWDPGIVTVLLWPAAIVLGAPGLILLLASAGARRGPRHARR